MDKHGPLPLPREALKHLLDIVLIFRFNDTCYKQIQGTAIGTKMAPADAGIFMFSLKTRPQYLYAAWGILFAC